MRIPSVSINGTAATDIPAFLQLGRAGVIAFFAISGFVVASTIKEPKDLGTRDFITKRFFRLYPAFWLTLLLTYLANWLPQGRTPSLGSLIANASMLPSVFGVESAMGHFWTLEIEFVFYMLVVLLFLTGKLRSRRVLVSLIAVLILPLSSWLIYKLTWTSSQGHWAQLPYCIAIMLWASLLRQSYVPGKSVLEQLKAWATPAVVLATCLVFSRAIFGGLHSFPSFYDYMGGRGNLWGLLLFVTFLALRFQWPGFLVWLGTISYSIYLLHPVVLYPFFFGISSSKGLLASAPLWVYIFFVIGVTVALASLSYVLVESPSNAIAKRLVASYRRNSIAQRA